MARKKEQPVEEIEIGQMPVYEGRTVDELLRKYDNKYLLVNLLSRRAGELKRGARSLVDIPTPHSNLELALAEANAGLLRIDKKEVEQKIVNLVEQA